MSGNLLYGLLLKFSGGVVKIASYKSKRTFPLKNPKKSFPWCCSDLSGFFFGKLLKFFQQGCWNCNLRVNSKHLMRKFLIFLSSLSHFWKTISPVSRKFSDEVVKNFIFLSRRTISWNIFLEDLGFLFILGLWHKFFSLSFCRDF